MKLLLWLSARRWGSLPGSLAPCIEILKKRGTIVLTPLSSPRRSDGTLVSRETGQEGRTRVSSHAGNGSCAPQRRDRAAPVLDNEKIHTSIQRLKNLSPQLRQQHTMPRKGPLALAKRGGLKCRMDGVYNFIITRKRLEVLAQTGQK